MRSAIIVGASSGLGLELARVMAADGWRLGLAGRNMSALEALRADLGPGIRVQPLDVMRTESVAPSLDALLEGLGSVDCVVLSSGISPYNRKLQWALEESTIATNVAGFAACATWAAHHFFEKKAGHLVAGFAACATWAAHHFFEKKAGHLVGISSVASLRGSPTVPAYNASKAFVSHYLEGLRFNLEKYGVSVTDIRPGYVDTPMTKGQKGMFWVVEAPAAARQIYSAILRRKKVAYVPRRWALVALAARMAPGSLYRRLSN